MDARVLLSFACTIVAISAWSIPYHHAPGPLRVTRYAPPPQYRIPVRPAPPQPEPRWERPKRQYDHDHDHRSHHEDPSSSGITGPVHTFVKTDKNANYKWGVRHHVGNKFAS